MVEQTKSHSPAIVARAFGRLAAAAAAIAITLMAFTSIAAAHPRRCDNAHSSIASTPRALIRDAVVCLINKQRAVHHLPGLSANPRLDNSAQGWTDEMVRHRSFTHGADFAGRISAAGFDWSNAGENIAFGYQTPSQVVGGWMASTGHCQNILSPVFREVGTGVSDGVASRGSPGTWTQDFGLLMGEPPASGNDGPAAGCPYR
ncbi:MAG: CAP domain-containing protein [Solirubrobacterales bacterium]|nr:CAP domain-containing protein [Solirubrobacterales bacterium]